MLSGLQAWFATNIAWLLLAALLSCGTYAGLQTLRLEHARTALAGEQRDSARLRATIAQANADAEAAARVKEKAATIAQAAIADAYERGKTDAQAAADRVVADLRAGAMQLRREWAGCETSRLSDAAAGARALDEAEQRRAEGAGRIVRAADECDAQVTSLQAIVRADREVAP